MVKVLIEARNNMCEVFRDGANFPEFSTLPLVDSSMIAAPHCLAQGLVLSNSYRPVAAYPLQKSIQLARCQSEDLLLYSYPARRTKISIFLIAEARGTRRRPIFYIRE